LEMFASSAASVTWYWRHHQCGTSSHCCRLNLNFEKKLPSRTVVISLQEDTVHLYLFI